MIFLSRIKKTCNPVKWNMHATGMSGHKTQSVPMRRGSHEYVGEVGGIGKKFVVLKSAIAYLAKVTSHVVTVVTVIGGRTALSVAFNSVGVRLLVHSLNTWRDPCVRFTI